MSDNSCLIICLIKFKVFLTGQGKNVPHSSVDSLHPLPPPPPQTWSFTTFRLFLFPITSRKKLCPFLWVGWRNPEKF